MSAFPNTLWTHPRHFSGRRANDDGRRGARRRGTAADIAGVPPSSRPSSRANRGAAFRPSIPPSSSARSWEGGGRFPHFSRGRPCGPLGRRDGSAAAPPGSGGDAASAEGGGGRRDARAVGGARRGEAPRPRSAPPPTAPSPPRVRAKRRRTREASRGRGAARRRVDRRGGRGGGEGRGGEPLRRAPPPETQGAGTGSVGRQAGGGWASGVRCAQISRRAPLHLQWRDPFPSHLSMVVCRGGCGWLWVPLEGCS